MTEIVWRYGESRIYRRTFADGAIGEIWIIRPSKRQLTDREVSWRGILAMYKPMKVFRGLRG